MWFWRVVFSFWAVCWYWFGVFRCLGLIVIIVSLWVQGDLYVLDVGYCQKKRYAADKDTCNGFEPDLARVKRGMIDE